MTYSIGSSEMQYAKDVWQSGQLHCWQQLHATENAGIRQHSNTILPLLSSADYRNQLNLLGFLQQSSSIQSWKFSYSCTWRAIKTKQYCSDVFSSISFRSAVCFWEQTSQMVGNPSLGDNRC